MNDNNQANGVQMDWSQPEPDPSHETSRDHLPEERRVKGEDQNAQASQPIPEATDDLANRLRGASDAILRFFAHASTETLVGCAVGLFASTYFILGRFGLLLIGVATGMVLHATWDSRYDKPVTGAGGVTDSRGRRELGTEVVKRVLDWRETMKTGRVSDAGDTRKELDAAPLDLSKFPPATATALTGFVDAVIRDYVNYWYDPIRPGETTFPASCRQILTSFILSISDHLSRKRPADAVLDFLANSTSILIVFLNELSTALKASNRQDPEDAVQSYLARRPDSNLAHVLSGQQQERKLNLVAEDILQNYLDSKAFALPVSRTFLREVLAGLVLGQTITTCSKPDWINGWIVYLLEDGEPELMNAIDAGVEDMSDAMTKANSRAPAGTTTGHHRRVSRAEEAMQDAMLEAKRLSEMIADDDARRKQEMSINETDEGMSAAITEAGIATPTSSDSDRIRASERSMESSMMFDSDGNVHEPVTPSQSQTSLAPAESLHNVPLRPVASPSSSLFSSADTPSIASAILTIHNAAITIYDDADPVDKSVIKQKPSGDYLIQIEPASSKFPGWMIPRKYGDFEPLHETLRRIAVVSGAPEFAQRYTTLPAWKGHTRIQFTQDLERYLQYALQFERLAESEAMKKFLDKDRGLDRVPTQTKKVLSQGGAALENVGKGFINVLGQGGKGIAGGGKAVLGGVQGVFGAVATGVGAPKRPGLPAGRTSHGSSRKSPGGVDTNGLRTSRDGHEEVGDVHKPPPLPSRPSRTAENATRRSRSSSRSGMERSLESLNLPPPPSDMLDDYTPSHLSTDSGAPALPPRATSSIDSPRSKNAARIDDEPPSPSKPSKNNAPVTEEETRVSIELMFAVITELYSLSSAWTIRLSLLAAARTFLLRPNNPQLESIRALLQETIIDANFSDTGLAAQIRKMRENTLPTEDELKTWPAPLPAIESEKLRVKARKLLVERGMPQALTGVMGAAASGEALGRVFDCLQVEAVARGLVFALLLQALRAATQ